MAPKRSRSNAAGSSNTPAAASPHEDEELPDAPGASPSDSSAAGSPAIDEVAAAAPAAPQPAAAADPLEEEDDGEELIGEDMETDYRPMGALDAYEEEGLDGNEYEPLDARSRAAVDAMLDARDGRERQSRLPAALLTPEEEDEEERPRRRRREAPQEQDAEVSALDGLGLDEDDSGINLEDYSCTLQEWIQTPAVSEEIKRRFRRFLANFTPPGSGSKDTTYAESVRRMCAANKESLEVNYQHLSQDVPILAIWVADAPQEMFELLDAAAFDVVKIMFPDYEQIKSAIHVRITNLPIQDSIRDLRQVHMGCLVRISGVVTRRSGVFPQLKVCRYNCNTCGYILGPFTVNGPEPKMAGQTCPSCHSKGPYSLNTEQTLYSNYQQITLQESPGSVQAGRLPRHKEVILTWDLIDMVRPGEEVEVTGIYQTNFDAALNKKFGFPVFATVVEANHLQKKEDADRKMLTEEDQREILRLSKDPQIRQKIISSIAPSIFGHEDIKTALALSMFGGNAKDVNGKHRIRGDINVLLLGDPGTAKSQFLKYVEKTSPRAIFTTGQGASAVGLTASVHKEPVTREWTLEGGALVLADQGVCLIDEFDKMNDSDRTSIHEAMEQQSISIAKAGITASLRARCAVIAAANPVKGRYDPSVSFSENVDLTEPILSRFDCICVVKDKVDPIEDERLAEFVVDSHKRNHPRAEDMPQEEAAPAHQNVIDQALLRKYITYARQHTKPVLHDVDQGKIAQVYTELRRESQSGGVSIAVRHIESVIRMAEASARMHLRNHVRNDDVDLAISVLLKSMIKSQKMSVMRTMERKFRKYLVHQEDSNQLIDFELRRLYQTAYELHALKASEGLGVYPAAIDLDELEGRAREMGIADLSSFYTSETFTAPQGFRRTSDHHGKDMIVRAADSAVFDAVRVAKAAAQATEEQVPVA